MSRQADGFQRETRGFTLRPDVIECVEELSEKHGIAKSQVVEDILVEYMEGDAEYEQARINYLEERQERLQARIDGLNTTDA